MLSLEEGRLSDKKMVTTVRKTTDQRAEVTGQSLEAGQTKQRKVLALNAAKKVTGSVNVQTEIKGIMVNMKSMQ